MLKRDVMKLDDGDNGIRSFEAGPLRGLPDFSPFRLPTNESHILTNELLQGV